MRGWLYAFASDPEVTITAIWGPQTREEADRRLIPQLLADHAEDWARRAKAGEEIYVTCIDTVEVSQELQPKRKEYR